MDYKNLSWKTLSSEYIHKGPWATLRTDKCEMPSGHIVEDYYVLEYPNWVNAVAITEDNKILMVRIPPCGRDCVARNSRRGN
jgi:ADP-ribose pyrophosphatase